MISNPLIDVDPDTTTFDPMQNIRQKTFLTEISTLQVQIKKWCTDVTEVKIPTTGEKLFISPMIDL